MIPLLALLGVFGETSQRQVHDGGGLQITLEAPERFRYKLSLPLSLRIANTSNEVLPRVKVVFSENYIEKFSNVTFTPQVSAAYEVLLGDLAPGEKKQVHVELQANDYGRHEGAVKIVSDAQTAWETKFTTLVFP